MSDVQTVGMESEQQVENRIHILDLVRKVFGYMDTPLVCQKDKEMGNYIYIVECRDKTLYTGWTNNLEQRVKAHNAGRGAKYTRSRRPVRLCYWEAFATRAEAMRREVQVKRLNRSGKMELIARFSAGTENGSGCL